MVLSGHNVKSSNPNTYSSLQAKLNSTFGKGMSIKVKKRNGKE